MKKEDIKPGKWYEAGVFDILCSHFEFAYGVERYIVKGDLFFVKDAPCIFCKMSQDVGFINCPFKVKEKQNEHFHQ